jgi:hypothetical protein
MNRTAITPIHDSGPAARTTPCRGISLRLPMLRGSGAALASGPF